MYEIFCFLIVSFSLGLFLHWLFYRFNVSVGVASQAGGRGIFLMSLISMSLMLLLLMCIDWISPIRQMEDYRIWIQWSFLLVILFLILSKEEIFWGWRDFVFHLVIMHFMGLLVLGILKLILIAMSIWYFSQSDEHSSFCIFQ
jgi:hypothetical protein